MTRKKTNSSPAEQATRAGNNGNHPPAEHRWKPGQSGNPAGRPKSAGATVCEHWNDMADWPQEQLEACANDPLAPIARRAAARNWLLTLADPTEVDRIIDHTHGRPRQSVDVTSGGETIGQAPHHDELRDPEYRRHLIAAARRRMALLPGGAGESSN